MNYYSSETIKRVIEQMEVSREEQEGNELFYEAFLSGLFFTFADKSVHLSNEESFMQLILYLRACPPAIQEAFVSELPDLHEYFTTKVTLSSLEFVDSTTS